ncbi:MAG: protoporphyrinogen oxidase [Cyanobacteria bacterium SIG32]|nr:protoporphyrinogen oxidase [Cyanobacteria bacterium SIG32]
MSRFVSLAEKNVRKIMDVSKLKTTEFLANYFGISARRVQQLAQDNIIPSVKEKGTYYFDPPIAIKKYITFLQDALNKKNKNTEEHETKKLDAEIRLKEAKATVAEIELSELKGKMHRSEDVQALIEDLAATIKGMIAGLPGRLAMDVVNLKTAAEVSDAIEKACFEILDQLAEYEYDPDYFKEKVQERGGLASDDIDSD